MAVVVNDWRCKTVEGMETALMLWETYCISSLLHEAGTWTEINVKFYEEDLVQHQLH